MIERVVKLYYTPRKEADEELMKEELHKLADLLRARASLSRGVEIYSITKLSRGGVEGYVLVRGERREEVELEAELIKSFVKSALRDFDCEVLEGGALSKLSVKLKDFL